jgi:hypothetical protein
MRSLEKEQQRVEGFSPELAVVTYAGGMFGLAWSGSEPARRPSATIPAPRSRAILGEQARGRMCGRRRPIAHAHWRRRHTER